MENSYGLYSKGSSGWTSMKNEEFQEGDVWGIFKERKKDQEDSRIIYSFKEPSIVTKQLPSATRMIPRSNDSNNSNTNSHEPNIISRNSAPQNIPDWSKIYGASSEKSCYWVDPDPDSEEEEEDARVVPPHEWIARRQMTTSFSVCEGAGRTLKGRDLSRVRNAVLSKTGFLESNSGY